VIPEDVQTTISTLEKAVSDVEKHIESYLKTSVDEITNDLSTEDGARLSVLLAYALNTLFYSTPQSIFLSITSFKISRCIVTFSVYLKTQGVDPADHPVKDEIVRPSHSVCPEQIDDLFVTDASVLTLRACGCRSESKSTSKS
jgi:hypothetical protein